MHFKDVYNYALCKWNSLYVHLHICIIGIFICILYLCILFIDAPRQRHVQCTKCFLINEFTIYVENKQRKKRSGLKHKHQWLQKPKHCEIQPKSHIFHSSTYTPNLLLISPVLQLYSLNFYSHFKSVLRPSSQHEILPDHILLCRIRTIYSYKSVKVEQTELLHFTLKQAVQKEEKMDIKVIHLRWPIQALFSL